MRSFRILVLMVLTAMSLPTMADSEAGLILGAEVEKELNRKLDFDFGVEMRTRNDFRTIDRWDVGLATSFKFNKWLRASGGYNMLYTNFREKITYNVAGLRNKWRPSYWGVKHRFNLAVTGTYKFGNNIRLSLRERWQYTYRPGKTVQRWDFSDFLWEDHARSTRGKNQLRSRFQIEYDKKRALFTPYASIEFYHSWGIEKIRYTAGTDIHFNKKHALTVFYRYQNMRNVDEDDYNPDMHYLSAGYKFKF